MPDKEREVSWTVTDGIGFQGRKDRFGYLQIRNGWNTFMIRDANIGQNT